jgi:hypothetical protein
MKEIHDVPRYASQLSPVVSPVTSHVSDLLGRMYYMEELIL